MININISRKHILFLVFILAVATVINYTIAQGGTQSHPISEVTDLDTNVDGVVDLANNSNYLGGQLPSYYEGGGCAAPLTQRDFTPGGPGENCVNECNEISKDCAFGIDNGDWGDRVEACNWASYSAGGGDQCMCCA